MNFSRYLGGSSAIVCGVKLEIQRHVKHIRFPKEISILLASKVRPTQTPKTFKNHSTRHIIWGRRLAAGPRPTIPVAFWSATQTPPWLQWSASEQQAKAVLHTAFQKLRLYLVCSTNRSQHGPVQCASCIPLRLNSQNVAFHATEGRLNRFAFSAV